MAALAIEAVKRKSPGHSGESISISTPTSYATSPRKKYVLASLSNLFPIAHAATMHPIRPSPSFITQFTAALVAAIPVFSPSAFSRPCVASTPVAADATDRTNDQYVNGK